MQIIGERRKRELDQMEEFIADGHKEAIVIKNLILFIGLLV